MDISLIQGTITGLKLASEIAKGLIKLNSMSAIKGKVIELQNAILSAQSSALSANAVQSAMIEEIRTLKEEITRIKAWEGEKKRYKLISPWGGTVVYALKESMSQSEPPHWICTKCYEDGRKSILTQQQKGNSIVTFMCPMCGSAFQAVGRHRHGFPLKYAE